MAKIKIGTKAPDFKLKDKDGTVHSLKDLNGEYKVLFFYPKDDTPGCTVEAIQFTGELAKFKKANIALAGISGGNEKSKTKFCEKHDLKVLLLSDEDFSISKKYDSFGKKSFMGREYEGIFRNTFVLDTDNKILGIFESVKPDGHPKEVLEFIKSKVNA